MWHPHVVKKSCCCLKSHKSQWIFLDSQLVYHDISYHSSPVDQKNRLFQPTYPIETVVHSSKFLFNLILSIRFFCLCKSQLGYHQSGIHPIQSPFCLVKSPFYWVKTCENHIFLGEISMLDALFTQPGARRAASVPVRSAGSARESRLRRLHRRRSPSHPRCPAWSRRSRETAIDTLYLIYIYMYVWLCMYLCM